MTAFVVAAGVNLMLMEESLEVFRGKNMFISEFEWFENQVWMGQWGRHQAKKKFVPKLKRLY